MEVNKQVVSSNTCLNKNCMDFESLGLKWLGNVGFESNACYRDVFINCLRISIVLQFALKKKGSMEINQKLWDVREVEKELLGLEKCF